MSKVLEIYTAESGSSPMQKMEQVQLEAGKGIVGDRYYSEEGTFSEKLAGLPDKEITLVESEEIDQFNNKFGFNFNYGDFRRNIVTKGIRLNSLEGKEFTLGAVRLRGIRLCEPCAHLANILAPEVVSGMLHKSGLRAEIINTATIKVGDIVGE